MVQEKLTRKELYDLVWSEPLLTLSKKYNISDVGLRKICIRLNIPLPRNGHWQKVQYGKKVTKTPLPPAEKEEVITFGIRDKNSVGIVIELSPLKVLQKEIEEKLKDILIVPDRLTKPDKLIISAKERLNSKDNRMYKGLISSGYQNLDIKVSRLNIRRALLFMDTLIKALYARKHDIRISQNDTMVIIDGHSIPLSLREKTKKVLTNSKDHWNLHKYIPDGLLIIKLDNGYDCKEITDGRLPLEKQIALIIAALEMIAIKKTEWNNRIQKNREERELKEKIRREYEKRQDEDLETFRQTLNKAERWHKAINLRNYINEVESKAIAANNITEETQTWLTWVRKKADWYDPFIETEDELLNEVDKETLTIKRKSYY